MWSVSVAMPSLILAKAPPQIAALTGGAARANVRAREADYDFNAEGRDRDGSRQRYRQGQRAGPHEGGLRGGLRGAAQGSAGGRRQRGEGHARQVARGPDRREQSR